MFDTPTPTVDAPTSNANQVESDLSNNPATSKYKNMINLYSNANDDINYNMMDKLLEKEKQHNKTESWIKLDKTVKVQKLHQYAEKYGKDNTLPVKDIKSLKLFFIDCLEKNKLSKTKDVTYNKESHEIIAIPALHFNQMTRSFTLKITDGKRVSTLKSLTPKRFVECDKNNQTQLPNM